MRVGAGDHVEVAVAVQIADGRRRVDRVEHEVLPQRRAVVVERAHMLIPRTEDDLELAAVVAGRGRRALRR